MGLYLGGGGGLKVGFYSMSYGVLNNGAQCSQEKQN